MDNVDDCYYFTVNVVNDICNENISGVNDTCTAATECLSANHLTCDTAANKCKCEPGYNPGGGKCQKGSNIMFILILKE